MSTSTEVFRAWAITDRIASSGNLVTNGVDLYSYQLRIGFTDEAGFKVVIDYTADAGYFKSSTTSKHVNAAKRWGTHTVIPGDPAIAANNA